MVSENTTDGLKEIAKGVRIDILKMIHTAGSGHLAGSLSAVEIFISLYFEILKDDDELFVSNGHVCPAQYVVMAQKGLIDEGLLSTYAKLGSPLQGHPERNRLAGIISTSGPLGLGLAQAVGYAKALKMDGKTSWVYCLTSDAEHEEGNHWEAILLAKQFRLNNLIVFVDRNRIQIEKSTEEVAPLGLLTEKYKVFGWNAFEVNGHSIEQIIKTVEKCKDLENLSRPSVIVANTIAGKGVSFMQGNPSWHAKVPNEEEFKKAIEELNRE